MQDFRVEINGSSYVVSVEKSGEKRYRATVGKLTYEAEATSEGELTTWLVQDIAQRIHAQAKSVASDRIEVWLTSVPYPATVQAMGAYSIPAVRKGSVSGQVRALMPGRVTSVLVKEGEQVRENAPLLILEAMKMQNEITSPVNGTVKAILVHEGETVKRDFVLMSIE